MPNGMPSGLSRGPRRTSGGDFAESEVHGERELPRSPLGREVDLAQLKRQSRIQAWVSSSQQRWSTFSERRSFWQEPTPKSAVPVESSGHLGRQP